MMFFNNCLSAVQNTIDTVIRELNYKNIAFFTAELMQMTEISSYLY
jgi:hypothetical protein